MTAHWRIGRAFNEHLNALLLERYNLGLKDFLVLASIERGAAYPTDVSERLKLPKDMTSRILQTLLKGGLIARSIDERDSRRTQLAATQVGKAIHREVHDHMEALLEPLLAELGTGRETFLTSLETLNDSLQTLSQPGEPHV